MNRLRDCNKELIKRLKKELSENASKISFTTDIWTTPNHKEYMSVSYHYINAQYELKSGILDFMPFPGSHNGEEIARKMLEMLIKFELINFDEDMLDEKDLGYDREFFENSKVFGITTDNAANNGTFIGSLTKKNWFS